MEEGVIAFYAAWGLLAGLVACIYGLCTLQWEFCLGGAAVLHLTLSYANGEYEKRKSRTRNRARAIRRSPL